MVDHRPLKILFIPYLCSGPVNQLIGLGDVLHRRGHEVIMLIDQRWKGKISSFGLKEYFIDFNKSTECDEKNESENVHIDYVRKSIEKFRQPTIVQVEQYIKPTWKTIFDEAKSYEEQLSSILDDICPDVIIQDYNFCFPTLLTSSIPWIRLISCNPLEIPGDELPPTYSGLSQFDQTQWNEFRLEYNRVIRPLWENVNQWVQQRGVSSLPDLQFNIESPHGNLYIYPEEVDYTEDRPLNEKWFRMNSSVRQTDEDYHFPQIIKDRPKESHLIYLSLGTLGCSDVNLLQHLIDVLSQTKHFFIISKGPLGDQLKLSSTMVGESTLPQTKIIPLVDLVITHGGNNTIVESLHFGKPMIVLPIFWDQYDNAQRIHDLGFGIRLSTYSFTDQELLRALDQLLNDLSLRERMEKLGEKIRQLDGLNFGADVVERVAQKHFHRIE